MDLKPLVERAKAGDREAMAELYQQTCQRVYALALRLTGKKDTAMDVVQESYLSALEHLEDLRNPEAFLSWMFQIAANRCRKALRQEGRFVSPDNGEDQKGTDYFDAIPDPDEALIPEAAADSGETRRLVMELVNSLPPEQRECVILFYFSQCPVEQIAQVQGCAEGTVKSRLNYARKKLKEGVLALEARDNIRLHTLVPVGLLFACLDQELPGWPAFFQTWTKVAAGVGTTGAAAASAGAASAGAGQGAGAGAAAAGGSQAASGVSAAAKGVAGALKMKIAAGVAAAAVLAGGAGVLLHQPAVTFSDPVFEQNIRILLDKPTGALRESDLMEITVLRINDDGMMTDLSQDFQELAVEGTQPVSSLADVALFPDLDVLHCNTHNANALLNTLTDNPTLHYISSGSTQDGEQVYIEDLSFLDRLPNLTYLFLNVAANADLTLVEEHESLRRLDLRFEEGGSLDVSRLTGLYWLTLSSQQGTRLKLETTRELPELMVLELGNGGILDFSLDVLSNMPALELLDLDMVKNLDLAPVARLPHLRALALNYRGGDNPPADLTPLLQSESLELCGIDVLPEGSTVPPQLPVSIQEWEQYWTILYEIQDRVNQRIRENGPA